MRRMEQYLMALEAVLERAEAERDLIRSGGDSAWEMGVLERVVCPEVRELLEHARMGEVFFRFGKRQRLLESTYVMTDSMAPLGRTVLGQKISELQKIYNRL